MIFIMQLLTIPIFFLLSYFSLLVVKHNQYLVQIENNLISLRNMQNIADRLNADMKYVDPSQIPVDFSAYYYVATGILVGVVIASLLVVLCRSGIVDIPSTATVTPYVPGPPCVKCNIMNNLLTENNHHGIVLMSPENFERLEGTEPLIQQWLFKKTISASGNHHSIQVLEKLGDIGDPFLLTDAQICVLMRTNQDFCDVVLTLLKMQ